MAAHPRHRQYPRRLVDSVFRDHLQHLLLPPLLGTRPVNEISQAVSAMRIFRRLLMRCNVPLLPPIPFLPPRRLPGLILR